MAEVTDRAQQIFDDVVSKARERARHRVAVLRAKYPKESRPTLAKRLVKSFSRRAGLGGAATGVVSFMSLGLALPAGVAVTLALEAELLLSLLELYGLDTSGEIGRLRLYALWAGTGLADAAKSVGLKLGAEAVGAALAGSLPARLIAKLNPALVKFLLKRLGLSWVPKAMKLWPVIGAPIGYMVDSTALTTLGSSAISTLEAEVGRMASVKVEAVS
jgi:hypothetical protein